MRIHPGWSFGQVGLWTRVKKVQIGGPAAALQFSPDGIFMAYVSRSSWLPNLLLHPERSCHKYGVFIHNTESLGVLN